MKKKIRKNGSGPSFFAKASKGRGPAKVLPSETDPRGSADDIYIEGPAKIVFEGTVIL